ncbi:MAG: LapA family protein [Desulfatiglandales bacterium]
MMKAKTTVVLVLIALFVIILIENTQVVSLRLFFWKISMSQIILTPLTMLIGFVIGYIVAKVTGHDNRREKA